MKYEKLVCVDTNGDDKLSINKKYRGKKHSKLSGHYKFYYYKSDNSYFIYDDKTIIDIYPDYMFKTIKQIRKERLNNLI